MNRKLFSVFLVFLLGGCASASEHRRGVQDDAGDKVTVGKVQREIRVGMSSAQVIEVLGSPNVVTTDEERREVWVYDKISTSNVYSTNENGLGLLVIGAVGRSGAPSTTQKTLTIVIKFDATGKVRDFAYHNTSF